jgi:hypothetical protein
VDGCDVESDARVQQSQPRLTAQRF